MSTMHAARLEKSPRLQRALAALKEAGMLGLSSWEWVQKARLPNPGTTASELRKNGYVIDCELLTTYGDGTRIYLYRLMGREKP